MKRVTCLCTLVLLILFSQSHAESSDEHESEKLVHDFYTWYFKTEYAPPYDAMGNKDIYNYLDDNLIEYLNGDNYCRPVSYATKINYDFMNWEETELAVHSAVKLNDDGIYVIPVNFKGKNHTYNVIVLVKNGNGRLRISKIIDMYPLL